MYFQKPRKQIHISDLIDLSALDRLAQKPVNSQFHSQSQPNLTPSIASSVPIEGSPHILTSSSSLQKSLQPSLLIHSQSTTSVLHTSKSHKPSSSSQLTSASKLKQIQPTSQSQKKTSKGVIKLNAPLVQPSSAFKTTSTTAHSAHFNPNILDSRQNYTKQGKTRLAPKKTKPTPMKKLIRQERLVKWIQQDIIKPMIEQVIGGGFEMDEQHSVLWQTIRKKIKRWEEKAEKERKRVEEQQQLQLATEGVQQLSHDESPGKPSTHPSTLLSAPIKLSSLIDSSSPGSSLPLSLLTPPTFAPFRLPTYLSAPPLKPHELSVFYQHFAEQHHKIQPKLSKVCKKHCYQMFLKQIDEKVKQLMSGKNIRQTANACFFWRDC